MRARHTSTAATTCSTGRSASDSTDCGPLTITSCAPVAGSAVNSSGARAPAPAGAGRSASVRPGVSAG